MQRILERVASNPEYIEATNKAREATAQFLSSIAPMLKSLNDISSSLHTIQQPLFQKIQEPLGRIVALYREVESLRQEIDSRSDRLHAIMHTVSEVSDNVEHCRKSIFLIEKIITKCEEIIALCDELINKYDSVNVDWEEFYDKAKQNRQQVVEYLAQAQQMLRYKKIQVEFLEETEREYKAKSLPSTDTVFDYCREYVDCVFELSPKIFKGIHSHELHNSMATANFSQMAVRIEKNKKKSYLGGLIKILSYCIYDGYCDDWRKQSSQSVQLTTKAGSARVFESYAKWEDSVLSAVKNDKRFKHLQPLDSL